LGPFRLYQSGGAYGFRDQLQDVMALVYSAPAEARAQILRSAARRNSRRAMSSTGGTRRPGSAFARASLTTSISPFVVHHYVVTTGDKEILDEVVPFITSPLRDDRKKIQLARSECRPPPSTSTAFAH
jgi:cellobiose phosphorylase